MREMTDWESEIKNVESRHIKPLWQLAEFRYLINVDFDTNTRRACLLL